jgi:hypothetical protein
METISIELPGTQIDRITLISGTLRLHFARAGIIKTMTGSAERTRWWQAGELAIEGAEPQSPLPDAPVICAGGDVDENIYTYRDMVPMPLDAHGRIACDLKIANSSARLHVIGTAIRLEMEGIPKYIEHIRPGSHH